MSLSAGGKSVARARSQLFSAITHKTELAHFENKKLKMYTVFQKKFIRQILIDFQTSGKRTKFLTKTT